MNNLFSKEKRRWWLIAGLGLALVLVVALVIGRGEKPRAKTSQDVVPLPAAEQKKAQPRRAARRAKVTPSRPAKEASPMPEDPMQVMEGALQQQEAFIMESCVELFSQCFKMDENEAHNYCYFVDPGPTRLKDPCEMFGYTMFFACVRDSIDCDNYRFGKNKGPEDPYNLCKAQVQSAFVEKCKAAQESGAGLPMFGGR